ncbi:hypothetical protein GSI_04275 [Ganoderma sinense ZZ0214-1]|uniref:Uncharacterized protein n=1 Tax=Ganoderma sinense ZZ0214-1 TaxID=1077348 RepID=A0A2G8SIR1_9APHY|nr:hypothetical protein GSI_04275 [Ganoderma sinense ZZ0214-1]
MWLLHTSTGQLEHFNSPDNVKGGYAILSHVWQQPEMSFQELQALSSQPSSSQDTLLARASPKIRECCKLAESHGYQWLWIDTCCIDRSSSAELSEAVNSMFAWYSRAHVCYAYLYDVPTSGSLHRRESAFRTSRWFSRGWTLQELIAPRNLVFVSQDWTMIGTKASLASLLEEITGIDADVLTFRRSVADVSVARRMWWASTRKTTRIEDEAYSLMGLFGVHMPTIYGEGARAFPRLQEEILKRTSDQTLFAWGNVLPVRTSPLRERITFSNFHHDSHLFAPSPAAFCNSGNMTTVPVHVAFKNALTTLGIHPNELEGALKAKGKATNKQPSYSIPLPDYTVTTAGVRSRMLVLESSKHDFALAIAVLAVRDESTGSGVGLLLRRRRYRESKLKYPRYHIGVSVKGMREWMSLRYRMAQVEWAAHALSFGQGAITAAWKQLYISHRAASRKPPRPPSTAHAAFRFVFPRWLPVELKKVGFEPDVPLPMTRTDVDKLSDGGALQRFTFIHRATGEAFRIQIGQCGGSPWATANIIPGVPSQPEDTAGPPAVVPAIPQPSVNWKHGFDCGKNSVDAWPNGTKTFGDSNRSVQLTFTRMNEGATHLLDIRLGGRAYRNLHAMGRKAIHTLCRALPLKMIR